MPTSQKEIVRALTETEKLQKTIANLPPGDFKQEQQNQAQKLKGDLLKSLAKESNRHEC